MNIKAVMRRHPLASYFGIAFTISWLGAFLVVASKVIQGQALAQTDGLLMFPVLLVVLGSDLVSFAERETPLTAGGD